MPIYGEFKTEDSIKAHECACRIKYELIRTPVSRIKSTLVVSAFTFPDFPENVSQKNNTVIFESTVYPGVTENVCVPIIEKYFLLL